VIGFVREEGKIAVGVSAADDFRTGRPVDGQALGADGDAAIVADFSVKPVLDTEGRTAFLIVEARDITEHKRLEQKILVAASAERRRIGQDLHDTVSQELTALTILAGDLAEGLRTNSSNGSNLVQQIVQGLRRSRQELLSVMRGLLPVAVDTEGLMAALSDLADRIQNEGKVTCQFECPKPVSLADNLTATHLFLIAQEAVHNAVKHAQPRNIRISLESNDLLALAVQNDGKGMPAAPTENHGGLGLRIMRNRAQIIGATLTVQPAEPTGTLVTCALVSKNDEKNSDQETSQDPDR